MNYILQDICCLCLNISNNDKWSGGISNPDFLSVQFTKIKTTLWELSTVMNDFADSKICKKCCETIDFIYDFNKTCLKNLKTLSTYKKKLKENSTKTQNDMIVMDPSTSNQYEANLTTFPTIKIEPQFSSLDNDTETSDINFDQVNPSNEILELKKESEINEEICNEGSEISRLESEMKIEIEEINLKEENVDESTEILENASLKPNIQDFETISIPTFKEEVVKEEEHTETIEEQHPLEVGEEKSYELQQGPSEIHTTSKVHKCDICGKLIKRKVIFKQHMLIHTGERPYKCDICEKTFRIKSNLNTHMLCHADDKPHKCDVCGISFKIKSSLNNHMKTHTGEKPHKCNTCGKSFNRKEILKTHMLRHTGEKPYKCNICGHSSTTEGNLKKHILTHTGEKPYKCDICEKLFGRNEQLKRHMLTHTGEKPHQCDICGKSFSDPNTLKKHKLTHTGEKPHKCDKCEMAYTDKRSLVKHLLKHAGFNRQ